MKVIMMAILSLLVLACSRKKDEMFSLEEANACLLESDKSAVREAVRWIKKPKRQRMRRSRLNTLGRPTIRLMSCMGRVVKTIPWREENVRRHWLGC